MNVNVQGIQVPVLSLIDGVRGGAACMACSHLTDS